MQTPFRAQDVILVIVVISSMAAAIVFPDIAAYFDALPFYCLMVNFFLSYLSIDLEDVRLALKGHGTQILGITLIKLVLLPVLLYFLFYFLAPPIRAFRPAFSRCFRGGRLADDLEHGARQFLAGPGGGRRHIAAGAFFVAGAR